jgi:hypothetical protein
LVCRQDKVGNQHFSSYFGFFGAPRVVGIWRVSNRTLPACETVKHHLLLYQNGIAGVKVHWVKNGEGEGFQEINYLEIPVHSRE